MDVSLVDHTETSKRAWVAKMDFWVKAGRISLAIMSGVGRVVMYQYMDISDLQVSPCAWALLHASCLLPTHSGQLRMHSLAMWMML